MGDRSNVVVLHENGNGIGIYTHSSGSDLPRMVAKALKFSKPRWGDLAYFTRMFFCNLLDQEGETLRGELGWGLYPYTKDGMGTYEEEHETIFVDTETCTVAKGDGGCDFETYIEVYSV